MIRDDLGSHHEQVGCWFVIKLLSSLVPEPLVHFNVVFTGLMLRIWRDFCSSILSHLNIFRDISFHIIQHIYEGKKHYLWIEVKSLESVDNQGILCEPIVHDGVKTIQEWRSLDNGFVIGIVQTLQRKEKTDDRLLLHPGTIKTLCEVKDDGRKLARKLSRQSDGDEEERFMKRLNTKCYSTTDAGWATQPICEHSEGDILIAYDNYFKCYLLTWVKPTCVHSAVYKQRCR